MLLRRLLAAFMILVSLTAQARAAVACEAMPGSGSPRYCCPAEGQAPCAKADGARVCCDQGSSTNAPLAQAVVSHDASTVAPIYPVDPLLLVAADFHFLPVALEPGDRYRLSPELTSHYRLRPLYLQTARLRL